MPTIEFASNADGPSVFRITNRVRVFTPSELSCVEELWNAYRDRGEASGYVFLVYRDDDSRAWGYACFGPHPLTQGTYDLYWIAVDTVAQEHGIGHALLARVEAEVQNRDGRLLLMETSDTPAYAAARRLYETSGYRCEARVPDFYAAGDDLLIYVKRIACQRADPAALGRPIGALRNRRGAMRQHARELLVAMGGPAVKPLVELLGDPEQVMRWEAAKALGEIADPRAARGLAMALEDTDFEVRWLTAEGLIALGRRGLPELMEVLIRRPQSMWVRQGTRHVLRELAGKGIGDLVAPVL